MWSSSGRNMRLVICASILADDWSISSPIALMSASLRRRSLDGAQGDVPAARRVLSGLRAGATPCRASAARRTWLQNAGYTDIHCDRGLQVNDSAAVIQAAIAGSGVALGRTTLVAKDLAEGRLVRPFGDDLAYDFAYYIVHPPQADIVPGIAAFITWLLEEARKWKQLLYQLFGGNITISFRHRMQRALVPTISLASSPATMPRRHFGQL